MPKTKGQKSAISENYFSLGLGILVVLVIGALIFNYIGSRSSQPGKTPTTEENAASDEQKSPQKASLPTKHKVVSGEDLWKISEQYYKSGYNWTDIAQANNLSNPNIVTADMELTIPNVEPKLVTAKEDDITQTPVTGNSQAIKGDSYTVASGDYLWDIAVRAYGDGFKWTEIAKANNLTDPNLIFSGNVLKIPR